MVRRMKALTAAALITVMVSGGGLSARAEPASSPGFTIVDPQGRPWSPAPSNSEVMPPGFHAERRMRTGLMWIGFYMLSVSYAFGLASAVWYDFDAHSGWMAIPVAGPWLALLGNRTVCDNRPPDPFNTDDCQGKKDFRAYALTTDGLLQGLGAALIVGGALARQRIVVRDKPAPLGLMLTPHPVGAHGYGALLSGLF